MRESPPVVLVAPDKFRSTASALELRDALERRMRGLVEIDLVPLSDGGEGFLEALGGAQVAVSARDPGSQWREIDARILSHQAERVGIIEVARIVGRDDWSPRSSVDAVGASSAGVADAILRIASYGVDRIVVGAGGSATSDGGRGLYDVLRSHGGLTVPVSVATDVRATFHHALDYAPQKGVSPDDLLAVARNLATAAERFLSDTGVDVSTVSRSGAAGGIAGALYACGATLEDGFDLVAAHIGLQKRLDRADVVVTGEGRLDTGSLDGKVVGSLLTRCTCPVVVVCGSVEKDTAQRVYETYPGSRCVSLVDRLGSTAALWETPDAFSRVAFDELRSLGFVTDL